MRDCGQKFGRVNLPRLIMSRHHSFVTGLFALLFLSSASWGQLKHGDQIVTVVKTAAVNVRSSPEILRDNSFKNLMGRIPRGTQMKWIGKRGAWYQVILPDGRTAWVHSRYTEEGIARDLLEVTVAQARVRQKPAAESASRVIARVKKGDMLRLERARGDWFLATLPDGSLRGWVRQDMVVRRPVDPSAESPPPEEAAPRSPEPEPPPVVDHYQLGLDHVTEGHQDQAIDAFREALKVHPNDGAIHFELAKLLRVKGEREEALNHFKAALEGDRPRPEARFHLEAMLKPEVETGEDVDPEMAGDPEGPWTDRLEEGAIYLLPALAIGSLVFLVALGLFYRKRRAARLASPVYRRRKPDGGFDSVLKYAVEKRPLLRAIEEAERKQAEMDEALRQRFDTMGKGGPKLPNVESTDALIKRVEDLRQTILSQEERAQIYADLVLLQNEKIDALDEEIDALKKLIVMNFQDGQKEGKQKGKAAKIRES